MRYISDVGVKYLDHESAEVLPVPVYIEFASKLTPCKFSSQTDYPLVLALDSLSP